MSTNNQCFEHKKKKNLIIFHLKSTIFTAVKYCFILFVRVCVMGSDFTVCYYNTMSQDDNKLIKAAGVMLCGSPKSSPVHRP